MNKQLSERVSHNERLDSLGRVVPGAIAKRGRVRAAWHGKHSWYGLG
jgi:hypothetical protein